MKKILQIICEQNFGGGLINPHMSKKLMVKGIGGINTNR